MAKKKHKKREGRKVKLLRRCLNSWNKGVRNWQKKNESIPAAFTDLVAVMNDVQLLLVRNSAKKFLKGKS